MRTPRLLPLLGLLAAASCAHRPAVPADAQAVVLSVTGMDCADCWDAIRAELAKEPGFYDATFDKVKAEITVKVAPQSDAGRMVAAVERAGFKATVGPGRGAYLPMPDFPAGADMKIVARAGEDVPDLSAALVTGKITVVDFYADWCEPCRKVDEHMKGVLAARADVAYRKMNIVDWDTPLAKRYMAGIPELPFLIVHGRDGTRVATVAGLHLDKLDEAIRKAAGP